MVLNDPGPRMSRASTMTNSTITNAHVGAVAAASSSAGAIANADESASAITVNTKTSPNFPPPKTDKPRPHVCSTCQRSFARLEHLKRHERSHTKEKPFECPACSRCFARRDLLLRHQQKLHQAPTPSSRPRNRRESASGVPPGQSRARKNSVAGTNPSAAAASAATPMRPRANTISHVDVATMQMIASTSGLPTSRGTHSGHIRHQSLAGLPLNNFDQLLGGVMGMGQRGMHVIPKLETVPLGGDFDGGLHTAPPRPPFASEFDLDNFLFGAGTTINPNALHYNDSPPSMTLDQTSPFVPAMGDLSASQVFDDGFDWLSGFEHQMSFQTNDNVVDESSPSALSTTSQSGISDVMVDGSNHPVPAGTSTMWQASLMGPPQMSNPFAMDLNGSVFPDLLNGAPLSPQPASQKINDPYFSTDPSSLSSLSPLVVSGLNAQNLTQTLGFSAGPGTPSSLGGVNHGASPVTTITDVTRNAIVNSLSQCQSLGSRKISPFSQASSQAPHPHTGSPAPALAAAVPSTQNLQRYVASYITYFHPHLPFLHLPTLSFEVSPSLANHGGRAAAGVGGSGCLVLAMAAIGALYEMEHTQSKQLFDMTKKMIFFHLEERRVADVRKADVRRTSSQGPETSSSAGQDGATRTPVWLVQALLLNVMYGHNCADQSISDIASTHCAALVSLAEAAELGRREIITPNAGPDGQDTRMADDLGWTRTTRTDEHHLWLRWKAMEERKRTLYAVFIVLSLLVATYNHPPVLTNSEILLDLPCDEEFFAAESSARWLARGGLEGADRNRLKFCDALGDLLRTNEKQQRRLSSLHQATGRRASVNSSEVPITALRPSTFGCLILINALHNYIWETRQRHHNKVWTVEETEKMHRHIEPALRAWRAAWSSNPQHSSQRPNPFGMGPLASDAMPLLDLAYIRLFFNVTRSKEKFWQRDWEGMAEELARGSLPGQQAGQSPAFNADSGAADIFNSPFFNGIQDTTTMKTMTTTTTTSTTTTTMSDLEEFPALTNDLAGTFVPRRELHLRKAASYAVDSLAMSYKVEPGFSDLTSRELPLQSAMCVFDCAQVLGEWVATLQDRVGRYLGVLGEAPVDASQFPALMLLEGEDVSLLERAREVVTLAEMKLGLNLSGGAIDSPHQQHSQHHRHAQQHHRQHSRHHHQHQHSQEQEHARQHLHHHRSNSLDGRSSLGVGGNLNGAIDGEGLAASILRLTGRLLDKAAVWPVTHLMARCLESHAAYMRKRAEDSILGSSGV